MRQSIGFIIYSYSKKMWKPILLLPFLVLGVASFGSDEKFLKKYALIKIFESCFGDEVVKDIRKEMKAACAKCAVSDPISVAPTQPIAGDKQDIQHKLTSNSEVQNTLYANQQSFPTERLHEAILAFRPSTYPQAAFRPYQGSPTPFYQPFVNPSPMFYGANYAPSPFPTSYPAMPYSYPYVNQPYFDSSRVSRTMEFRNQLDVLSSKMNSKVSNITCVMQELGYLDANLEPNYEKISERIAHLPVAQELRQDIQDGVTYCQQFSSCIPEPKKGASPLTKESSKPMLFFKCYKYKKLEACIMKDVREKISNFAEDDFDGENVLKRAGKSMKLDEEKNVLSSTLYDFLYGIDGELDFGSVL